MASGEKVEGCVGGGDRLLISNAGLVEENESFSPQAPIEAAVTVTVYPKPWLGGQDFRIPYGKHLLNLYRFQTTKHRFKKKMAFI